MEERNSKFSEQILISIIVPVWNTPKQFLTDMIDSVLAQTYPNWELCIADGASSKEHVREVLDSYAQKDKRIKVKYLSENKGIAGNSNEAISLATGDYVALLDHDDMLAPFALLEIVKAINENPDADFIYSDEDKISEDGRKHFNQHFKPDFSPDMLRSFNYINHLSVIKKTLLGKVGYFREGFEGSQNYYLILRCTEQAKRIVHIPKILYHRRVSQKSVSRNPNAKLYAFESAKMALKDHLERLNLKGTPQYTDTMGIYKINYEITNKSKVSIIIPNKDHKEDLERCINSIITKSTYKNYEVIIIENNSTKKEIFDYYENLKQYTFVKVLVWEKPFNYSAINNFAAKQSTGDILLFLNNDTEVISQCWIEEMLMFAHRSDVGAVGAKLLYKNNTIQHAGIIIGLNGTADHCFKYSNADHAGYFGRLKMVQNLSAVTGACLMMRKEFFEEVNGFDEGYPIALNDIDLCLRIRDKSYLVVWTPYAMLYHHESRSSGFDNTPNKIRHFEKERELFHTRHADILKRGDPYYNPNLSLNKTNFEIVNYEYSNKDEKYSADGIFYLRVGKIEEAKELFRRSLAINPKNQDALFCLSAFELQEGNPNKALEYLCFLLENNILKHDIQTACVYNNLGIAYVMLGDKDKGFEFIEKAHNLYDLYVDAQHNIEQKNKETFDFKITRKLIM